MHFVLKKVTCWTRFFSGKSHKQPLFTSISFPSFSSPILYIACYQVLLYQTTEECMDRLCWAVCHYFVYRTKQYKASYYFGSVVTNSLSWYYTVFEFRLEKLSFVKTITIQTSFIRQLNCKFAMIKFTFGWCVGFYGISTFVSYLMPNPFLCKLSALFQTIQFSRSTQFNFQNSSNSANSV